MRAWRNTLFSLRFTSGIIFFFTDSGEAGCNAMQSWPSGYTREQRVADLRIEEDVVLRDLPHKARLRLDRLPLGGKAFHLVRQEHSG